MYVKRGSNGEMNELNSQEGTAVVFDMFAVPFYLPY